MKKRCAWLVVPAVLGCATAALADTITVCLDGSCDFDTIQAAIDSASDDDVIEIAAGTYYPSATIDTLGKAVTLRGELGEDGEPVTVLDGQGAIRVLQCTSGEDAGTVFENLVITSGYAKVGGGMYNSYSSPTLSDCTFTGNSASSHGGGMYNYDSSATLIKCTFANNTVSQLEIFRGGGGMANEYSSPILENCTFENNSASIWGGGMYNQYSSPILDNCTFTGNSSIFGGGMCNEGSSPTLTNCTFSGNLAYNGGGMHNIGSSPTVMNTVLCGNSPDQMYGTWIDHGQNCLASSCVDDNSDGMPDKCDGTGGNILYVPSKAYPTLASAIAAAAYSDVVSIAAGTYQPVATLNTQGKPITLRGAVDGEGVPTTIIDGQDSIRVVQCTSGEGADTIFQNLVIAGGRARYGVGLVNNGSSPTVTNCMFTGNLAGGMENYESSPTVTDCMFTENATGNYGGGMLNSSNSSPTLTNCTFTGNSGGAGGMYNFNNSSPTLENCTFTGNSASSHGGGMGNSSNSSPILTNCTFMENSAEDSYGGGMYNRSHSSPTLDNCTFENNSSNYRGGGMYNSAFSSPTLTNCTFTGNSAETGGSGIFNTNSCIPTLNDCVFTACCQVVPPNSFIDKGGNDYDSWCDDCRANVDCVNGVDGADLTLLLGAWGTDEAQYDLNDDGTVNGADLALMLGQWGPCP